MIRNIKGNNLLRKYQDGENITTPTVSPNAIAFTSGFETNRGYANNGYTSSAEPRNMSNDYGYILKDVPEPLQVVLLDAVHNQSNLPGTMVLALAKNNPVLYQELAGNLNEISSNAMQSAMMLSNIIGTTKAYEGKDTLLGLWIEVIKPEILKAYNENPKQFIDDFTKSRIERNSSFGNKNTSVIWGSDSKMEEWAERSIAAAEYAKDLIDGDAEAPDYYYDVNKNENVFKQQIKPIVDFTLKNTFPGDGTEDSEEWYNKVNDLYNTETKTIQDAQKNTINQVEEPNLNEVVPNEQQATTNLPVDEVLNDDVSNPPENTLPDAPATPPNDNYGADKQTVYYDDSTDKYHIIEDDIKWEVDETGEKINNTNKVLSTQEKNKFLTNIFVLDGPGDEPVDQRSIKQPTPLKTVGNVLNKGIEKIDKALRDKNPYRDDTYGPIKDKNKELREERKAERQKNQAVRRTGRAMKKKFNILEDTESIKQNRLNQSIRAEKKTKRAFDQLEAQKQAGDEKAKRIEGRVERTADINEFNEEKFNNEGELKLNKIESKQKIKTLKGKNRLNKKGNRWEKREKRELEKNKKLEEKALKLEEALEEKRYGGRLKYKTGGNLIKYQNGNNVSKNPIKGKHKIRMTEKQYEDYMKGALLDSIDDDGTPIYNSLSDLPEVTVNANEDYTSSANLIGGFNALKKKRERDRYVRDRNGKLLFKKPPKEYVDVRDESSENLSFLGNPFMYNNPHVPFTDVLNLANSAFNPFSWVNSLNKSGKNIKSGDYKSAGINAIDAIPGAGGPLKTVLKEAVENATLDKIRNFKSGGNLIKYQGINSTIIDPNKIFVSNLPDFSDQVRTGGYSTLDGIAHDPSGRPGRFINETLELDDEINYNKQYSAYDPYSLMRPSHKISDAANQAMTAYNLSLASQAPEKTPLFMTDYKPKLQYAPVDFKPATDQYAIGRREIANNARGTGTLMGNLQQLNANILNKKIDIAKRAADKQLGFDRTYETAKEKIAKELKDQKINQYYKDLEHKSTKQNAMTEAVSKWNQQQQTKAGYIQAENSDVNKINSYVNQLSADYNVRLDENGMAYVVHNKTGKKDDRETLKLNQLRRRNLTEQRGQAMKLMEQATDENDKIKYREEIKSLNEQLKKVGFYSGSDYVKNKPYDGGTQSKTITTKNKRGGNIKSKKTTNILMDGGYTPRNKRQKKLRTKLY